MRERTLEILRSEKKKEEVLQAQNRDEPMESKDHDKGGNFLKPVEITTPEQAGYLLKKCSLAESSHCSRFSLEEIMHM